MKLNRFNINVTALSILVAVSGFIAVHLLFTGHLWITRITFIGLWLITVMALTRYVHLTNRKLNAFLQSLRYFDHVRDTSTTAPDFKMLNLTFNEIIDTVGRARKDLEAQGHYYRNILEHAETGLLTFDGTGKIRLVNRSALDVLALNRLQYIDELSELQAGLPGILINLKPGENHLVTSVRSGKLRRLAFRAAHMMILDEKVTIISVQDIHPQLEEEELIAWQKLIAILRHEIMNSAAPLKSLSFSLDRLTRKITGPQNKEVVEDMQEGINAIASRTKSLLHFVEAYRTLTRIPEPKFRVFRLNDLINEIYTLYKPELKQRGIEMRTEPVDPDIEMAGDYNLLSQVLINLVRNALDAVENGSGMIQVEARKNSEGAPLIIVKDNGHGIGEDEQKNIFVPFFTTREGGSGIGLSLARQILRLHRATIEVVSKPGEGSTFKIQF